MPKAKVVNIGDRTLPTQQGQLPESIGKKRAKLEIHENVERALLAIERDDWEAAKEPLAHAAQLMRALERLPVRARKITRLEADPSKSQSLERGLIIIEQFAAKPVMGIAEVADATKQSRSTVHRYMTTLVGMGVLEQVMGRKYRLVQA